MSCLNVEEEGKELGKEGAVSSACNKDTSTGPQSARCPADSKVSDDGCFLTGIQPWQGCPGQQVVPLGSVQDRCPLGDRTDTYQGSCLLFGYGFHQVEFCFGVCYGFLGEEWMRIGAGEEKGR